MAWRRSAPKRCWQAHLAIRNANESTKRKSTAHVFDKQDKFWGCKKIQRWKKHTHTRIYKTNKQDEREVCQGEWEQTQRQSQEMANQKFEIHLIKVWCISVWVWVCLNMLMVDAVIIHPQLHWTYLTYRAATIIMALQQKQTSKEGLSSDVTEHFILSQSQIYSF